MVTKPSWARCESAEYGAASGSRNAALGIDIVSVNWMTGRQAGLLGSRHGAEAQPFERHSDRSHGGDGNEAMKNSKRKGRWKIFVDGGRRQAAGGRRQVHVGRVVDVSYLESVRLSSDRNSESQSQKPKPKPQPKPKPKAKIPTRDQGRARFPKRTSGGSRTNQLPACRVVAPNGIAPIRREIRTVHNPIRPPPSLWTATLSARDLTTSN